MVDGVFKGVSVEFDLCVGEGGVEVLIGFGVKFVIGIMVLSFWMLFMIVIYFYMWFEKVSFLLLFLCNYKCLFMLMNLISLLDFCLYLLDCIFCILFYDLFL